MNHIEYYSTFGVMIQNQKFYIFNGKMSDENASELTWENRAFRYGDGLFETIKISNSKPIFFNEHYSRLLFGLKVLKIQPNFSLSELNDQINQLIIQNNIINGAIRITVFRDDGGKYLPNSMISNYLIEIIKYLAITNSAIENFRIGLFTEIAKPVNDLGKFKSINSSIYVLASIYAKENSLDDALLINSKNHIIEGTSSNLFIRKGNNIFTPPESDGPVLGIIRNHLLESHKTTPYNIETKSITSEMIINADEVFLTNSLWGIKPVSHFQEIAYSNDAYNLLINILIQ